ncbi:hypothetical protein [Agromyces sp. Leaf222]|uniref:hypothetical protein n=1 Tax=Agromyces sp. Leaf222 TaxID=1735688 RepID=UPI0006F65CEF|nr:hypothetical protein [Agromyces sp. Leaf222]KQM81411.1 hypothetical protein ASE68_16730 [Agromyces sp. Leaf222]
MTSRWARVARGGVIAAFATFVAALSHTVGGGSAPGALAIALSFAFSALLCIAVVGARLSPARTIIAVSITQFALHALYSVHGASGANTAAGTAAAHTAGAHHHTAFALPLGAASASPFSYDLSMLVTHVVAVAVTVLAIRRGDAALRAALGAASLVVASVLPSMPVLEVRAPKAAMARARGRFAAPRALVGLLHLSSMRHRGPPQGFAAA